MTIKTEKWLEENKFMFQVWLKILFYQMALSLEKCLRQVLATEDQKQH